MRVAVDHVMTIPDDNAVAVMRLLAERDRGRPAITSGESAVAGLGGLLAVASDSEKRRYIGLDASSRVLTFGTEGATDSELYERIVGRPPQSHGENVQT
jgi:diaminopropionate ammonia-lyase